MTITELRKILKTGKAPTGETVITIYLWVTLTKDDGAHLPTTRTEALRLLQGQDGTAEANAVLDQSRSVARGVDVLIG
ncbi:MAG: hypothetical protein EPN91_08730 [Salinibacterium sp.]|nr:MAG: hypothetical protein EPN91_08730 [Salinibacterium sp.]